MDISDELYREVILDHFKSPRHKGRLEHPTLVEAGANPLCGDELEFSLLFQDGVVADIAFQGQGCSISQASASMMTEAVLGKSFAEIEKLIAEFKGMMLENKPAAGLPEPLEDARSLEGVKKYPVRVKCAVLSWNTLAQALKKIPGGSGPKS